jgi:uncharacterized membrane protein
MCEKVWNNLEKTPWEKHNLVISIMTPYEEKKSKLQVNSPPNFKIKHTMILLQDLNNKVYNWHTNA